MIHQIEEDVRRAVARCIEHGSMLRIRAASLQIKSRSKAMNPSAREIALDLLRAGIAARIPLEIELPAEAGEAR
jgi:hypothetical protein